MTHWKPYRVAWRGSYHYFDLLSKAREFIKDFDPSKIFKPLIVEKMNMEKTKFKNPKYTYAELYDDYEVWVLTIDGWKKRS